MDQRSLIIAIAALSLVFLLVLVAGGGGLDEEVKAKAEAELNSFSQTRDRFSDRHSHLKSLVKSDSSLFQSPLFQEVWPKNLARAQKALEAGSSDADKLRKLVQADDSDTENAVMDLLPQVSAARAGALDTVEECVRVAERRLRFKKDRPAIMKKAAANKQALDEADFAATQALVQEAVTDWPLKKSDLESRIAALESSVKSGQQAYAQLESMKEVDVDDLDFDRFIGAATTLEKSRNQIASQLGLDGELARLIEQLYWSVDRVLVDMNIVEGEVVKFMHQIQEIRTRVPDMPGSNATEIENVKAEPQKKAPYWTEITKAKYEANKDNLGMVLEHKPGGKYDHEVDKVTQPPGYAYMCPPGQKRNNYGYWNSGSGGSFWIWYGQYSLMRNMLWGPRYSPVYADSYRDYRSSHRSGRTWYGQSSSGKPRYGSKSTYGKTRYASSRYQRTDGFKNSRYVKTGGKYRGSRFERKSRSTGGTRRSSWNRSSSRSGSRFGGGK